MNKLILVLMFVLLGCGAGDEFASVSESGGSAGAAGVGGQAGASGGSAGEGIGGSAGASAGGSAGETTGGSAGSSTCPDPDSMKLLPEGFCIDRTEVTRVAYQTWLDTLPSTSGQPSECGTNNNFVPNTAALEYACQADCEKYPVVGVDWCDALAYCKAGGKRLCGAVGGGAVPFTGYPTAEGELYMACTSGEQHEYPYGDVRQPERCKQEPAPVGSHLGCQSPDPAYAGVVDLIGSVYEWQDACGEKSGVVICMLGGTDASPHPCGSHWGDSRMATGDLTGIRCCADPS